MVDYNDSSQLNYWLFESEYELQIFRSRANYEARMLLYKKRTEEEKQNNIVLQKTNPSTTNIESTTSATTTSTSTTSSTMEIVGSTESTLPITTPSSSSSSSSSSSIPSSNTPLPIFNFACDPSERIKTIQEAIRINNSLSSNITITTTNEEVTDEHKKKKNKEKENKIGYEHIGPWEDVYGKQFLNVHEEEIIISFYTSKLVNIIGPNATVPRLRRESKVLATAALLLKRFFLSNSIMIYDPKTIMVACAFLASKVEDVTADVRTIEEATIVMNAHVPISQIVQSEVHLIAGIHFYLLCFHPYKAVLAFTEDLRTFFKTSTGKRLLLLKNTNTTSEATNTNNTTNITTTTTTTPTTNVIITGQDLKPIYDTAKMLLDDVVVSDLPLFNTPGQVGLAALIAAQEIVSEQYQISCKNHNNNVNKNSSNSNSNNNEESDQNTVVLPPLPPPPPPPLIDFIGYVKERFPKEPMADVEGQVDITKNNTEDDDNQNNWKLPDRLLLLSQQIRDLKNGKYGCGHYCSTDMALLKKIHKKLKKVRAWGTTTTSTSSGTGIVPVNSTNDEPTNKETSSSPALKRRKVE